MSIPFRPLSSGDGNERTVYDLCALSFNIDLSIFGCAILACTLVFIHLLLQLMSKYLRIRHNIIQKLRILEYRLVHLRKLLFIAQLGKELLVLERQSEEILAAAVIAC